jgi:hypothetical protein
MARNDHSGYPLKWFKDQNVVRNAYECAICLEVSKDSVQVRSCGHQFCALCIDDILKLVSLSILYLKLFFTLCLILHCISEVD